MVTIGLVERAAGEALSKLGDESGVGLDELGDFGILARSRSFARYLTFQSSHTHTGLALGAQPAASGTATALLVRTPTRRVVLCTLRDTIRG